MDNLNKYQKIQIILFVSIIIAGVIFIISIIKNKKEENYVTTETIADMTSVIEEIDDKEIESDENENDEIEEKTEDTSWDEEAEDTKVDLSNEKNNGSIYYLKVNYTANVVTAYKKDNSGEYTVAVKAMLCSTGTATPTSGVYKMSDKYRWHQLNGGVYGQYCSRITGHILFHSVPYSTNSPDTLKYTAYDKLGTRASAGCIRLTVEDALWIYTNCASGTYVEFYSSTNPGPLGKPTAQKISSNEKCRNWDPTDPLPQNPWKTYVETASTTTTVESQQEEKSSNDQNQDINQNDENVNSNNSDNSSNSANNTNTNSSSNNVDNTQTDDKSQEIEKPSNSTQDKETETPSVEEKNEVGNEENVKNTSSEE